MNLMNVLKTTLRLAFRRHVVKPLDRWSQDPLIRSKGSEILTDVDRKIYRMDGRGSAVQVASSFAVSIAEVAGKAATPEQIEDAVELYSPIIAAAKGLLR